MASNKQDQGKSKGSEGVPREAPPKNPRRDQKVPPPDRQNADNIAPGHGRRIPDKD